MTTMNRLPVLPDALSTLFEGPGGVDNSLIRRDGTGRDLQDSGWTCDDDGTLRGLTSLKTPASATDGTTVTIDGTVGDSRTLTLGGNRTLTFTDFKVGQFLLLTLKQDGTGGRTVTWDGDIDIYWSGGSAPVLTTTANYWDVIGLRCISLSGSDPVFEGFICGQNFGSL